MPEAGIEEDKTVEMVISESVKTGKIGSKKEEETATSRDVKRSGVVVSERDLELFEWVAEHRFSTKALLIERFYSEPTRVRDGAKASGQYGAVRLRAMIGQGYLRPSKYRVLRESPLLVSDLGYRLLHGRGRVADYRALPDIDIENFEHDVWVQKLRIQFERDYGCKSWSTERAMKLAQQERQLPYLPDGRFYGSDDQPWNLEVERTPKRLDRLREVLGVRAEASRKSRVLYVLDRRFSDFYREQMALSQNPACFFVTHFDELERVSAVGRPGVSISLSTLFGGAK
jgi:hypothetical protein